MSTHLRGFETAFHMRISKVHSPGTTTSGLPQNFRSPIRGALGPQAATCVSLRPRFASALREACQKQHTSGSQANVTEQSDVPPRGGNVRPKGRWSGNLWSRHMVFENRLSRPSRPSGLPRSTQGCAGCCAMGGAALALLGFKRGHYVHVRALVWQGSTMRPVTPAIP